MGAQVIDRKGEFSEREGEGSIFHSGRHRRLAKAGSPATARGCGELAKGSPRRGRCRCRMHFTFNKKVEYFLIGNFF